ncbi:MAG: hypothetical protein KDA61_13275, partial [Planctomycetales bacterium]|nr:hypothetical protein [Planctomycetales bacterium]
MHFAHSRTGVHSSVFAARYLLAAIGALCLPVPAWGTAFWFTSDAADPGPGPSTLNVTLCGDIASMPTVPLYLWGAVDPGEILVNWSLSLYADDSAVIDFSDVEIYNPPGGKAPRYEYVFDSSPSSVTALSFQTSPVDRIDGMQAFTIDPANGEGADAVTPDASYAGGDAWLFATVLLTPVATGSTDLYLEIGPRGLNNYGESASLQTVTLGQDSDVAYSAYQTTTIPGDTADVQISLLGGAGDFDLDGD